MTSSEQGLLPARHRRGVLQGRGWATSRGEQTYHHNNPEEVSDVNHQVTIAREGETIIVQERYDSIFPLVLKANGVLHNRYGRFQHDDIIGKPLGLRWDAAGRPGGPQGRSCRGFVHALAPSPALWSMAMHHRTQVVYPHDSAIISLYLDLRPGSILIESGTGAGSASIAFARVVAPHGRVLSFEFHEERAAAAARDFEALGVGHIISVSAGHDVLKKGFSSVDDEYADAVFLDLPAPYNVIDEAERVLKPNGALCTFSPCVEQVQRTCAEIRKRGFHSLRTITAPVRTYETRALMREAPGFDEVFGNRDSPASRGVDTGSVAGKTPRGSSEDDAKPHEEEAHRRGPERESPSQPREDQSSRKRPRLDQGKQEYSRNIDEDSNHAPQTTTDPVGPDTCDLGLNAEQGAKEDHKKTDVPGRKESHPGAISTEHPSCSDEKSALLSSEAKGEYSKLGPKSGTRPGPKSASAERSSVYASLSESMGGADPAGRVLRPSVPVASKPFPTMKGHTSYLTFARRSRNRSRNTPNVRGQAAKRAHEPEPSEGSPATPCKTM